MGFGLGYVLSWLQLIRSWMVLEAAIGMLLVGILLYRVVFDEEVQNDEGLRNDLHIEGRTADGVKVRLVDVVVVVATRKMD
nr:hypothetical protein [Tanacetum cinerariifolium]